MLRYQVSHSQWPPFEVRYCKCKKSHPTNLDGISLADLVGLILRMQHKDIYVTLQNRPNAPRFSIFLKVGFTCNNGLSLARKWDVNNLSSARHQPSFTVMTRNVTSSSGAPPFVQFLPVSLKCAMISSGDRDATSSKTSTARS